MKHETLDIGVIASAKMRYCSSLLNYAFDILQMRRTTNRTLMNSSGNGKWGLQNRQLHHDGDAIQIFNNAWSCIPCKSAIKCWIKSECIGSVQTGWLQLLLEALQKDSDVDIYLTSPNQSSRISGEIIESEHNFNKNLAFSLSDVCDVLMLIVLTDRALSR